MPHESKSTPREIQNYLGRISGPLLDRIDLHIEVPQVKFREMSNAQPGESSALIRERVIAARAVQHKRLGNHRVNAKMSPKEIREMVPLDKESEEFMKLVMARMNLSARVFDRLLKVARTIADLAHEERVVKKHLAEAVQYRERTEG